MPILFLLLGAGLAAFALRKNQSTDVATGALALPHPGMYDLVGAGGGGHPQGGHWGGGGGGGHWGGGGGHWGHHDFPRGQHYIGPWYVPIVLPTYQITSELIPGAQYVFAGPYSFDTTAGDLIERLRGMGWTSIEVYLPSQTLPMDWPQLGAKPNLWQARAVWGGEHTVVNTGSMFWRRIS